MENTLFETKLAEYRNISGIYQIRIKNKTYIGSSVDIGSRLSTHRHRLLSGKHNNPIMINCFKKHGKDECYFSILEEVDKADLITKESFYINTLNPKLNCELNPVTQNNCLTSSKVVYQFDLKGKFIKNYPSAREAERQTNIKAISHAARTDEKASKYKSAGGYLWSYTMTPPIYVNNSHTWQRIRKKNACGSLIP